MTLLSLRLSADFPPLVFEKRQSKRKVGRKEPKNGCLAAFGTTPSWPGQCFGATQKYDLQLNFYLNFVHFFRHFQCFGVFFRR